MANKRPSAEQMDERITLPLAAEKAIEAILKTGPHPDDEDDKKPEPRKRAARHDKD